MHIGIIMDGNGRWAEQRSLPRSAGHLEGLKACIRVVKSAVRLNVNYLTLYAFSTENWKRPEKEVSFLMDLFASTFPVEAEKCRKSNIKLLFRGNIDNLPDYVKASVKKAEKITSECSGLTVVVCINYGGQDEIQRAVNKYIIENPGKTITAEDIRMNLDCPNVPDPDLIVRSAGEMRLSNFMLWDCAYAEFLSIGKYFPDWGEEEIEFCISELGKRNRKYGGLPK